MKQSFLQRLYRHQKPQGRFRNPYFKARRVKQKKRRKVLGLLGVTLFIAIFFAALASSAFRIDHVEITGLSTIPEEDIQALVESQWSRKKWNLFSQKRSYFFDKNALFNTLQSTYEFSELHIDVSRKRIMITAEEKISEVVWVSGEEMMFLDLNGVALRPLTDAERTQITQRLQNTHVPQTQETLSPLHPSMPIIFDDRNAPVNAGQATLTNVSVQSIIDFDKGIRRLLIPPKTYGVENGNSSWLRVDTHKSFDVLFDGVGEIEPQIHVLEVVLKDYEGNLDAAQYIDVRFGNRVYVK